jgi:ATP-dependent Clp protease ATP-binding subunit ClpA
MMFERFTHEARAAVIGAQGLARAMKSAEISAQHLLLALQDADDTAARVLGRVGVERDAVVSDITALGEADAAALDRLGIDLEAVRSQVDATFGPGALDQPLPRPSGGLLRRLLGEHIPFTGEAKKALESSLREARRLEHAYLGTEHILLGLVANDHGSVVGTFRRLGVPDPYATVRAAVIEELSRAH